MILQKVQEGKANIIPRISKELLETRLSESIAKGSIYSEQWYRKPEGWYRLTSFNNPYRAIHSELPLIERNRENLFKYTEKARLVFYGVGTGDTESVFVKWLLEKFDYAEVIAVDSEAVYLDGFEKMMLSIKNDRNSSAIPFLGLNLLFEGLQRETICPENSIFPRNTHICLGNTVGNFDQKHIFGIFERLVKKDEHMILGAHLFSSQEKIMKRYMTPLFLDFIFPPVKHKFPKNKQEDIEWRFNKTENSAEAWLGQTRIFRSKKYSVDEIKEMARKHNFEYLEHFDDGNCAIVVLTKK